MYRLVVRFACLAALSTGLAAAGLAPAPTAATAPAPASAPRAPLVVRYPSAGRADDTRGNYYVRLLRLALDKSDLAYDLQPSPRATVTRRVVSEMEEGRLIDVMWSPTTEAMERDLLPVRIPVDKGLLGWRLFLIDARDRDAFAAIQSLAQLKAFDAGQVTEWSDTAILRANGLPVVDTALYENLFRMLSAHRFRYLPRGVGEIDGEARNYADLGLVIEPHLALHYPYCTYFFVRRQDPELARQIAIGLRRARKDGTFEALFQEFNGPAIQRAALGRRLVFELANPLSPKDPLTGRDTCVEAGGARALGR